MITLEKALKIMYKEYPKDEGFIIDQYADINDMFLFSIVDEFGLPLPNNAVDTINKNTGEHSFISCFDLFDKEIDWIDIK